MSSSAAVWLTDVFLIVFGQQQMSTAQRNKIYQALIHTQYLLVDQFIVGNIIKSYNYNHFIRWSQLHFKFCTCLFLGYVL